MFVLLVVVDYLSDACLQSALLVHDDHSWEKHFLVDPEILAVLKDHSKEGSLQEITENLAIVLLGEFLDASNQLLVLDTCRL